MYEGIPFCPECHSYPCACDDNIIEEEEEEIETEQQDSTALKTNAGPISTAEPEIPDQEEMPAKTERQPTETDSDDS